MVCALHITLIEIQLLHSHNLHAVHEQSNVQHVQLANNTSVHLDSY